MITQMIILFIEFLLIDIFLTSLVNDVLEERSTIRTRRVEHKFQKISSNVQDLDSEVAKFDEQFESVVPDDEISHLQGDFSKISWDDSQSPTTNTLGDIGQSTPDNDIQDIVAGICHK